MIKNYGLLWERKYVHLGAGRNRGTLLGSRRERGVVDFRDQIGIYVLYDKDLVPVYVGQAGNGNATLFNRLKHHTNDHLWNRWEYFTWFGLRRIKKDGTFYEADHAAAIFKSEGSLVLHEMEGILIAAMEPKLNKQGANFVDAEQFYQEVDDNITELTLEDIQDQLKSLSEQIKQVEKTVRKSE